MSPDRESFTRFGVLQPDGSITNERKVRQSDLRRCPHVIVMAVHYREDGTCRCDDPEHTEMAQWGYRWDDASKRWTG